MTFISDLLTSVKYRVVNAPSDAIVTQFLNDSLLELDRDIGITIDSTNISTVYQGILIDMAHIKILRYMLSQESFSIGGEMSVNRREILETIKDMEKTLSLTLRKVILAGQSGVNFTVPVINE